jgi:S1-C subfamily serine protease
MNETETRRSPGSPYLRQAAAAFLLTIGLTSCSAGAPRPSGTPALTPASADRIPIVAVTGPTNQGSFDAVHAAQVLAPSVGLVIVNEPNGSVSEGSGFAIASQGGTSYLLTNAHVIQGGRLVQVLMPDGQHFTAQVQGVDTLEDIAILRVPGSLPLAQLADSTKVQVGQPVVAIGSPLGSQGFGSVTVGAISALHRTLNNVGGGPGESPESLADVLQTDAPINPGNSGGPLADGNGRVVGMNTAGNSSANSIGYAIPSRILQRIASALIEGRTPGHPYLGICYLSIADQLAIDPSVRGYGVYVELALPGTPAQRAGIQSGDVIERVDGVDLNNGQTLGGVLQLHNPGETVPMTILRNGVPLAVSVTLGDRPANGGSSCPSRP